MGFLRSPLHVGGSAAVLALVACGGGGSSNETPTYMIGGSVSGLAGNDSVTLANNGGNLQKLTSDGNFTLAALVSPGASYRVTVATQPAGQSCSVSGASGTNVMADVTTVAVTCVNLPQYAYVVNNGANSVSQYSITASGTLLPLNPPTVPTGNSPESVTVDTTHHYVFVTNLGDNTVSQYIIQANGTLASNAPGLAPTGTSPWALSVDTLGSWAYVVNKVDQTVSQFSIGADGVLQTPVFPPASTGSVPWNITLTPNGQFAYVSNHGFVSNLGTTVSQYSLTAGNGALAPLSTPTATSGNSPSGIAVDSSSSFAYVANLSDDTVSQYAIADGGELTSLSPAVVNAGSQPLYVAIDPSNQFTYVANFTPGTPPAAAPPGTLSQYTRDSGGHLVAMATASVATGVGPVWIAFDPFGHFVYVVNSIDASVSVYSIGPGGALQTLGTVAAGAGAFAIATTYAGS
jgi:6-phosphogluconolactonase